MSRSLAPIGVPARSSARRITKDGHSERVPLTLVLDSGARDAASKAGNCPYPHNPSIRVCRLADMTPR
jgi:hypothetical protein